MSTDGPPPIPPSDPGTSVDWLEACRKGNPEAEENLFHAYSERLIRLIRRRLSLRLSRRFDPEDIVLSAWRSFFVRTRAGEFTASGTDGDLWPLLVTLTLRKLSKHARHHQSAGRSVDRDVPIENSSQPFGATKDAETAAIIADEIEHLLIRLDMTEQEILILTLQGADTATIAADLGCTDRTVRRSLERIRREAVALGELDDRPAGPRSPIQPQIRMATAEHGLRPTHLESDVTLLRLAGLGAFSKVFRAIDRISGETVAVKFLRKNGWRERRDVASLLGEYETLMSIHHPGIVGVQGWGKTRSGGTFLVLEWIDGPNFNLWSDEHHQVSDTLDVLRGIAEALSAAHVRGIIHGDLKPTNVLRRSDGEVVLVDFGLARRTWQTETRSAVGGTAGFIAPELLTNGEPSIRSDTYSYGALGRRLLAAERWSAAEAHEPIRAELLRLLGRCLEPNPSNRPNGMDEVIQQLGLVERATENCPRR